MKVWLIVMDDHRCDPAYMVMSTKEKAQEAVKEIIEANYEREGEDWYDCYDRTKEECIEQLSYSNGEDYVHGIEIEVDNLALAH